MKRDDDLFQESLAQDEDVAWALAEATARPAPARLRERIVARHRRRPWYAGWAPARIAVAAAALALIVGALAFRTEIELVAALPGARVATLSGAAGRGAVVVQADDRAYLVIDLPAPPAGKAYEAWVIRDGTPQRAGMAPARGGIVVLRLERPVRPGDVTAVTLEVAAGVDAPTSEPVLAGRF